MFTSGHPANIPLSLAYADPCWLSGAENVRKLIQFLKITQIGRLTLTCGLRSGGKYSFVMFNLNVTRKISLYVGSKTSKTRNLKKCKINKICRKFQLQVVNWCWPTLEILVSLDKKCRSANKTLKPRCAFASNYHNNANFEIICWDLSTKY